MFDFAFKFLVICFYILVASKAILIIYSVLARLLKVG